MSIVIPCKNIYKVDFDPVLSNHIDLIDATLNPTIKNSLSSNEKYHFFDNFAEIFVIVGGYMTAVNRNANIKPLSNIKEYNNHQGIDCDYVDILYEVNQQSLTCVYDMEKPKLSATYSTFFFGNRGENSSEECKIPENHISQEIELNTFNNYNDFVNNYQVLNPTNYRIQGGILKDKTNENISAFVIRIFLTYQDDNEMDKYNSTRLRYGIQNLDISISFKTLTEKAPQVLSFSNGISNSKNKKYRLSTNNLMQENIILNTSNRILNGYANGKSLASIEVNIDEYYDKDNVLAISTKDDSLPMLFKNGDIVIPYVRTSKIVNDNIEYGEEPLSGTIANPKEFIVIGTETFNKGYCGQRLTIREK